MNNPTSARWQRVQQLFEQVLEVEPGERSGWLALQCEDDQALRKEVEALLAGDAATGKTFDGAMDRAIAGSLQSFDSIPAGEIFGRYRILRLLGRGGMGAVYLAERADQQFEQRVALKLISSSLPGNTLAQRFRVERQILAQLNHPNIAHLLDGGASDHGVPYLAMEYIEGTRIDVYCDEHHLDVPQRLRLFQQVCSAVQYAHQNLIIHRDIKASNILIAADGTPKLLDFGIAKLLSPQQAQTGSDLTRVHERVLTPEHASPEQIRGEAVGTGSDIYSLGVLLYQLLTGVAPYSIQARTLTEIEQIICTVEPPRPSAAVAQRDLPREAGRALHRALAGDLDNIVAWAMHKDPRRRYASAAALSQDLDNHLAHRPVQARPDALGYRAGKFLRRNRVAASFAAVFMALLVSVVTFFTLRLAHERDNARLEARKAEQVAGFLTHIFRSVDPANAQGHKVTALEVLDQGARDVEAELAQQPLVQSDLLAAIGLSYKNLSEYDRAAPLLERSLALKSAARLEETSDYAYTVYELANLRRFQGKFQESEALFLRALKLQQKIFDGPHEDTAATLTHLGVLYYEMDRAADSLRLQEQALAMTREIFGDEDDRTADRMNNLALVLQDVDRHVEAEKYLRQSIRIRDRVLGPKNPDAMSSRYNLALLLAATGRYREAEPIFVDVLAARREVLGPAHPSVGFTLSAYGNLLTKLGRFTDAERALLEGRELLMNKYGALHWRTAALLFRQGNLELARGNYARARQVLEEAQRSTVQVHGDASENACIVRTSLAVAIAELGERQQATRLIETCYAALQAAAAVDSTRIQPTVHALAVIRLREGHLGEARRLFESELAAFVRIGCAHSPDAGVARLGLADVARLEGRTADALQLNEQALAELRAELPGDHPQVIKALEARRTLVAAR